MKPIIFFLYIAGLSLVSTATHAQYISVDESYTTQQLVENVLIANSCANVSNIVVSNSLNAGSGNSFGYFSANGSGFPFADGIILSTGRAASAVGPNNSILSEGPTSWSGDTDLEQALGVNGSVNATVLEFDFLPVSDHISFDYIFASEQYLSSPSSNQCNYTDGFVFLLKEVGTNDQYQNLAVIPNTNIPVKVNTVRGPGTICPEANAQYFGGFNGTNHPTNYNGQTVVLTAQAAVIPNQLYHIKLVVADQGNNLYDSAIFLGGGSFKIEKDLGPDRLVATNNPICAGQTLNVDATEPSATDYKWYKDGTQVATTAMYQISAAGTYTVDITLNGATCVSTGEIIVEYAPLPILQTPVTLVQCDDDNDGVTTYNLSLLDNIIRMNATNLGSVTYYPTMADAQGQQNIIPNSTAYQNTSSNQIFARVASIYGCASYAVINLSVANNSVPNSAQLSACDDDADGFYSFSLANANAQVLASLPAGLTVEYFASSGNAIAAANPLPATYINATAHQQIIYARIINGPDCYGIVPVTLTVNTFRPAGFEDVLVTICEDDETTLSAPPGYTNYSWNTTPPTATQNLTISNPGSYTVTVTGSNGCSATKTFIVSESEVPAFVSADVNDFSGYGNSVTINFTGTGSFEFSLDGVHYQESPIFTGLLPGEYLIYIRSSGCGIVGPYSIFVLDNPHYFTPNDDGVNDYWNIPFLSMQPRSVVDIFDRYGKRLFSFSGSQSGWNGKYGGSQMPATDYWFVLKLENGRIIKGHFSLLR